MAPNIDLVDFFSLEFMPTTSVFLKKMDHYLKELDFDYFSKIKPNVKRGECIFNFGGAINPKYAKGGLSTKFWVQGLLNFKMGGYKTLYVRASSPITTKMITGFGGKVIRTKYFNEPGLESSKLELLETNL